MDRPLAAGMGIGYCPPRGTDASRIVDKLLRGVDCELIAEDAAHWAKVFSAPDAGALNAAVVAELQHRAEQEAHQQAVRVAMLEPLGRIRPRGEG